MKRWMGGFLAALAVGLALLLPIQAAAAAQQLFAYGPLAQQTVSAAREAGMQCAYWYPDKPQLIEALKGCVRRGDLVWFKASRGMELEQVIDVLCREKGDE